MKKLLSVLAAAFLLAPFAFSQGVLSTAEGGLGADNSAATGVPVFSAGVVTVSTTPALGTPSALTLTNATGLPVAGGGTGRATGTTAYALIATGTTATGVQQSLAAGATTEILVGGGASALPVWTTATGSGAPVRATSPTITTGTFSGTQLFSNAITYGGVTLSAAVTGTGNMVLSAAPTLTGHPTIEGITSTGATGTGNYVFSISPTFTGTPVMGTALTVSNGFTIGAGASREPLTVTSSSTTDTIFHIANTSVSGHDWQLRAIGGASGKTAAGSLTIFDSGSSVEFVYGGDAIKWGSGAWAAYTNGVTTSSDALIAGNYNAATVGVTAQMSGRVRWQSSAWNSSGGGTAETNNFKAEVTPSTAAGNTSAYWALSAANSAISSGAYIDVLKVFSGSYTLATAYMSNLSTLEATTGGAGSSIHAGGIYAAKAIISGSSTASVSTVTGSGVFGGGIGVAGAGWFGGLVNVTGTITASSTIKGTDLVLTNNGVYFGSSTGATNTITVPSSTTMLFDNSRSDAGIYNFRNIGTGAVYTQLQRTGGTAAAWGNGIDTASTDLWWNYNVSGGNEMTLTSAGALSVTSSLTTGAPSGGTAAAWKLGTVVTGVTSTFVTTSYLQVDVGGTLYKVALITSVP